MHPSLELELVQVDYSLWFCLLYCVSSIHTPKYKVHAALLLLIELNKSSSYLFTHSKKLGTMALLAAEWASFLLNHDKPSPSGVREGKISRVCTLILLTLIEFGVGLFPLVDNWANVGGFFSGLLLGLAILYNPYAVEHTKQRISWTSILRCLAGFTFVAVYILCTYAVYGPGDTTGGEESAFRAEATLVAAVPLQYFDCIPNGYFECDS
jgi:hypothetical protein